MIAYLTDLAASLRSAFDPIAPDLAAATLLKGGIFMAYLWYAWFRGSETTPERRASIVISIGGAVAAAAVSRGIREVMALPDDRLLSSINIDPAALDIWRSFPSDHATLFFALSAGIWLQSRFAGCIAFLWSLLVICLPRVYLGYHSLPDIIGGAVLGVAVMAGTHATARSALWPRRVVTWAHVYRAVFYSLAFLVTYEIAALFSDLRSVVQDAVRMVKSIFGIFV